MKILCPNLLTHLKCAAAAHSEVLSVAEWINIGLVIHLCLSLFFILSHTYTQTHGCSLRKSCFIYETYSSESHRVLLRFQDCTQTVFFLGSLFFFCSFTHTEVYTHAAGLLFAWSAVLAGQNYSCLSNLGLPL